MKKQQFVLERLKKGKMTDLEKTLIERMNDEFYTVEAIQTVLDYRKSGKKIDISKDPQLACNMASTIGFYIAVIQMANDIEETAEEMIEEMFGDVDEEDIEEDFANDDDDATLSDVEDLFARLGNDLNPLDIIESNLTPGMAMQLTATPLATCEEVDNSMFLIFNIRFMNGKKEDETQFDIPVWENTILRTGKEMAKELFRLWEYFAEENHIPMTSILSVCLANPAVELNPELFSE